MHNQRGAFQVGGISEVINQVGQATKRKPIRLADRKRKLARETILDAAMELLEREDDPGDFSMRELAEAAGVSFATPFNHFGSKGGVLRELTLRLIADIRMRYEQSSPGGTAIDRVLMMASLGPVVCLERPEMNRRASGFVMFDEGRDHCDFRGVSRALWELALGELDGIPPRGQVLARSVVPEQLAIMFRGAITLWISGEISNKQLQPIVEIGAANIMLWLAGSEQQEELVKQILSKQPLLV